MNFCSYRKKIFGGSRSETSDLIGEKLLCDSFQPSSTSCGDQTGEVVSEEHAKKLGI